jgi:hypothetical protein
MMQLTPQSSQIIAEMARRYGISTEVVITMLHAVIKGGGRMAQFNHPAFGGSGQWMQGGMTMVGDMFNNALKAKVNDLCSELAGMILNPGLFIPPTPGQTQSQSDSGAVSWSEASSASQWWPPELGPPSSSGAQNNFRYAIFPAIRRLALDRNGQVTIYDSLDHQIRGVGQQQGPGASFTFTSQHGVVALASLPIVRGSGAVSASSPAPAPSSATAPAPASVAAGDILATIERLAALRQQGLLSEAEFTSKKAELLSRL